MNNVSALRNLFTALSAIALGASHLAACGGIEPLDIAETERAACTDLGAPDVTLTIDGSQLYYEASSTANSPCNRLVARG